MRITVYHNPRCSKSRQTLKILLEKGHEPEIIEYLKAPPDEAMLKKIILALNTDASGLMRSGENEYKAAKNDIDNMTEDEKIFWLTQNPKVIERPIILCNGNGRIGRPPENVLDII
jgi:arsenate reductase (glutaredoxin)